MALGLDQATLIEFAHMAEEHPDFKMPPVLLPLLAYQKSRVWKNAAPTQPLPPAFAPPRRADLLYRLHQQDGLEYIADYYSLKAQPAPTNWPQDTAQDGSAASAPNAISAPNAPTPEKLNLLAAQTDTSWKKSGDLYLFRDNRWYRDDRIEVPAALADKWLNARRKMALPQDAEPFSSPPAPAPGGFAGTLSLGQNSVPAGQTLPQSLEWKTEFAANLTRWQLANGLKWLADEPYARSLQDGKTPPSGGVNSARYFPFNQEADSTQGEYNLLRFYALLRPEQRSALLAGKLNGATLDAPQRSLALIVAPMPSPH